MASTRATNALKSYIAQSVARNETVTFDKIIFAHISGLNDATLANINNMPTVDQIKHTANIQQTGYIADDQVVYSVTLGSEIGDFTFNFVGLINSAKNVLGVAIYTGDIVKTRTKAEEQGNALTRNIILQVHNAKTLTNIHTQAKAWQFDFTDKFLQMKPKKITATTTNTADSSGHTHEIEKASTTQSGVVQLVDDWTTHDNRKALTASVGKRLYDTFKGLIDNLSNTAANALSKTTPKKITASTTNTTDQNGHTHEIEKASTTQSGIVQLVDDWTTHDNRKALTASVGKQLYDTLKGLIDNLSNTAANALSKTTPKKITATTTNATDQNGHTHEIDKASTSIAGVVKLNDSLTSNATDEALTAAQGKVLNDKIGELQQTERNTENEISRLRQEVLDIWSNVEFHTGNIIVKSKYQTSGEDRHNRSTFGFSLNIEARPYRRKMLLGGSFGEVIEANQPYKLSFGGYTQADIFDDRPEESADYIRAKKYKEIVLIRA